MLTIHPINTISPHFSFVARVLEDSFPPEERRNADHQRAIIDSDGRFRCCVIADDKRPVGLITYWSFDTFVYIEHFAIEKNRRGYGYGAEALKLILEQTALPVVLEVEVPRCANDIPHRRIAFYKRLGFHLRKYDYKQPPYRWGDGWLPMKLMTYGNLKTLGKVIKTIYLHVYGVRE